MKKFFTLLLICFSFQAFSIELPLAEVISEPENNRVHNFLAEVDENFDVLGMVRKADETTQKLALEEIVEGVVLIKKEGFDVITLSCSNCDSVHGGDINLKYLYSGLSKQYRDFKMELVRDGDNWALFSGKEKISYLKLVSRKFMGRLIGIKTILVNP